jgi:hypothetical protein
MSSGSFNAGIKACIKTIEHGKATHLVRAPEGRAKPKADKPLPKPLPTIAAPLVHTNASQKKRYEPEADMLAPPARHGAVDALQVPSRMGNRLHYRDGRVVDL